MSLIIMLGILILITAIIFVIVYFREIICRIREFFQSGIGYPILVILIAVVITIRFTNYILRGLI